MIIKKNIRQIAAVFLLVVVFFATGCQNTAGDKVKSTTVTVEKITALPEEGDEPESEEFSTTRSSSTTQVPSTTQTTQIITTVAVTTTTTRKQTTTTTQKQTGYTEADAIRFRNEIEAYAVSKGYTVDRSLNADNSSWGTEWGINASYPGLSYEETMAAARRAVDNWSQGSWNERINVIYWEDDGGWAFLPYTF